MSTSRFNVVSTLCFLLLLNLFLFSYHLITNNIGIRINSTAIQHGVPALIGYTSNAKVHLQRNTRLPTVRILILLHTHILPPTANHLLHKRLLALAHPRHHAPEARLVRRRELQQPRAGLAVDVGIRAALARRAREEGGHDEAHGDGFVVRGYERHVLDERVRNEGAGVLGVFGLGVGHEGDEAGEEEACDGFVGYRGLGLEEERADAVGGDFGGLGELLAKRVCNTFGCR